MKDAQQELLRMAESSSLCKSIVIVFVGILFSMLMIGFRKTDYVGGLVAMLPGIFIACVGCFIGLLVYSLILFIFGKSKHQAFTFPGVFKIVLIANTPFAFCFWLLPLTVITQLLSVYLIIAGMSDIFNITKKESAFVFSKFVLTAIVIGLILFLARLRIY